MIPALPREHQGCDRWGSLDRSSVSHSFKKGLVPLARRLRPKAIATMAKKKPKVKSGDSSAPLAWPEGLRPTSIRQNWYKRLRDCPAGLSLKEMAERLGEAYASVAFWAKKLNYPFTPLKRGRKSKIDWDRVDWSL